MATANKIFNDLFDAFQSSEFFSSALHPLSWIEETSGGIDRVTGAQAITEVTYSANAFLTNPSKSERPSQKMFKDLQAGDIVVSVQITELIKKPPINSKVTFNGENYSCKEIASDPANVLWRFLLRQ